MWLDARGHNWAAALGRSSFKLTAHTRSTPFVCLGLKIKALEPVVNTKYVSIIIVTQC